MLTLYCLSFRRGSHLLLTQDDHPPRFNWVPGGQVVSGAEALAILVSLPKAVSGCPGDADVVPAAITQGQRKLGHLRRARCEHCERHRQGRVVRGKAGRRALIVAQRKQGRQLEELHLQRDRQKSPDEPKI